ncbi:ATP-binding protein [Streptomyces sp. LP05-1]|uniref:ATP-binding protein n=1 Tax=Streptomyces pyxinae TaxID=2970734 RepID=A0ABT2CLT8_9ACTN|nr:ATP-binding protein [Streptomyces sp. LP05-1]MCS0638398.1 ATP-binding protein [Streptomyces sp. LP05-1]
MTTDMSALSTALTAPGFWSHTAEPGANPPLSVPEEPDEPDVYGDPPRDFVIPGGFAACGLGGRLESAGQARRFATATLGTWSLPGLVPDLEVVVSELVTNAVRHALGAAPDREPECPVWLGLFRSPGRLVCMVTDPSTRPPRPCSPDEAAEGGRGLALVGALSESWSWSLTPPRGKAVWATLPAPAPLG